MGALPIQTSSGRRVVAQLLYKEEAQVSTCVLGASLSVCRPPVSALRFPRATLDRPLVRIVRCSPSCILFFFLCGSARTPFTHHPETQWKVLDGDLPRHEIFHLTRVLSLFRSRTCFFDEQMKSHSAINVEVWASFRVHDSFVS